MKLSAMRISGVLVTVIALAVIPSASGADSIAWGTPVNGIRLGVSFGSVLSKPTLRIALQNVGSEPNNLVLGHEAGGTVYDSLKFIAAAPDGKQQEGVHRSLYVYGAKAGLMLPFSVRLNAGETHELEFPLKDIIYASRTTIALDALMKQDYSVWVRFESNQADANWLKLSRPWIGTLTSAKITPARSFPSKTDSSHKIRC
jgi:hypothetical protein